MCSVIWNGIVSCILIFIKQLDLETICWFIDRLACYVWGGLLLTRHDHIGCEGVSDFDSGYGDFYPVAMRDV